MTIAGSAKIPSNGRRLSKNIRSGTRSVDIRGEIYDVDLGYAIGHEPAFIRPAIVVSTDVLNNGAGNLVVIVPVGSTSYGLRSHVEIEPGRKRSRPSAWARCDQIRVISTERIVVKEESLPSTRSMPSIRPSASSLICDMSRSGAPGGSQGPSGQLNILWHVRASRPSQVVSASPWFRARPIRVTRHGVGLLRRIRRTTP